LAVLRGSIGKVAVRPGDRIVLATFAANRALGEFDPSMNPAAQLKQLWFGAGVHYCLGAPLAMAQIRTALDALLARPHVEIVRRRTARGVLIPSYASLELGVVSENRNRRAPAAGESPKTPTGAAA